jgi:prepilin-type N-terminal cleavage/methylation domain-containing protein
MKNLGRQGFSFIEVAVAIVLVGLIAGFGWYVWKSQAKSIETVQVSGTQAFYYTEERMVNEDEYRVAIHFIDPKTLDKSSSELTNKYPMSGGGAGSNQPLQLNNSGKVVAYATSVPGVETSGRYIEENDQSYTLTVGTLGGEMKNVVEGKKPYDINDWLLTHDGMHIVYIEEVKKEDKTVDPATLYVYEVATGETKRIGEVNHSSVRLNSLLKEVEGESQVRFYSSLDPGIVETTYDFTKNDLSERTVLAADKCDSWCSPPRGALSPDGTKLLVELGGGHNKPSILKILDLKTNKFTNLLEQKPEGNYFANMGTWSPNNNNMVVTSSPWGDGPADFEYQFIVADIRTGSGEISMSDKKQNKDDWQVGFSTFGWSPDGSLIAFGKRGVLGFYNVTNGKTTQTDLKSEESLFALSTDNVGWVLR